MENHSPLHSPPRKRIIIDLTLPDLNLLAEEDPNPNKENPNPNNPGNIHPMINWIPKRDDRMCSLHALLIALNIKPRCSFLNGLPSILLSSMRSNVEGDVAYAFYVDRLINYTVPRRKIDGTQAVWRSKGKVDVPGVRGAVCGTRQNLELTIGGSAKLWFTCQEYVSNRGKDKTAIVVIR